MSVFSISVNKRIQSLRDDSAMVGRSIRVKLALTTKQRDD